ncbi:MAG: chemotaxis protein CheX [Gemmatimonas sp.]
MNPTSSEHSAVSHAALHDIVSAIFSSTLGLTVTRADVSGLQETTAPIFCSTVHISGAWNGVVAIQCPASLARRAASTMMDIADTNLDGRDVEDALGELANVTAGNVKTLFPAPSVLGLPEVSASNTFELALPHTSTLIRSVFSTNQELFVVTVLELHPH